MNHNEFWVVQIKTIVTGILLVLILLIGSCQTTKYRIEKMVEHGAHPYAAACAVDSSYVCDRMFLLELERLK